MDANTIATATISLLAPYLVTAGQAAAKKAGEAAWGKVAEIHQAIKVRFQKEDDHGYSETMKQFEKEPEKYAEATQDALEKTLAKDDEFARSLAALLKEADAAGAGAIFNVNTYGGEVGKVINIDQAGVITIN